MDASKFVKNVACMSYHLRTVPSRHFTYEIRVKWSTGQSAVIYRRYAQFFNLQCKLLDTFPLEAGTYDPSRRTLPFLPGKKILGKFSEKTAGKRKGKLDAYLKALIELPNVSSSSLVNHFFESEESDLVSLLARKNSRSSITSVKGHVITGPILFPQYIVIDDYTKSQKGELSVTAGTVIEVIEKKHTGWWLAQVLDGDAQGWVPATYLDPVYGAAGADSSDEDEFATRPAEPERFIVSSDYIAERPDELTVLRGCVVEVLSQPMDGWWMCSYGGRRAMFPSAYLRKANTLKAKELLAISRQMSLETSSPNSQRTSKELSHYAPPRRDLTKPKPPRPPAPFSKKVLRYTAVADFANTMDDGVDLEEGSSIQVLTKDDSGWWYVEVGGVKGWAPSTYIQPVNSADPPTMKDRAQPSLASSTNTALKYKPLASSETRPQVQAVGSGLQAPVTSGTKPQSCVKFGNRLKAPDKFGGRSVVPAAADGRSQAPVKHAAASPATVAGKPPSRPSRPPTSGKSSPMIARKTNSDMPSGDNTTNTTVAEARAKLCHLLHSNSEINKQTSEFQGVNSVGVDTQTEPHGRDGLYYSSIDDEASYSSALPLPSNNNDSDAQLSVAELRKKLAAKFNR